MAQLLTIHPRNPQPRLIAMAAAALEEGGLIAHPTDTTYALGCHMNNKQGVETLYRLKKKSLDRPLSYICADLSHISEYAQVTDHAYQIMRRLLPGPYTFVLPARKSAPRLTQTKRKTIGIRVPQDAACHALLVRLGSPMISTSAKLETGELLENAEQIAKYFGHELAYILDIGPIYPEPSTIIGMETEEAVILREGKGSVADLF